MDDPYAQQADMARAEWNHAVQTEDLWEELRKGVEMLPEPTLGLKGGVNREAVLSLIERVFREERGY